MPNAMNIARYISRSENDDELLELLFAALESCENRHDFSTEEEKEIILHNTLVIFFRNDIEMKTLDESFKTATIMQKEIDTEYTPANNPGLKTRNWKIIKSKKYKSFP